jgi:hypothetical protein
MGLVLLAPAPPKARGDKVTAERVGAALNRNLGSPVAPGEQVEHEINQFIEKRHTQRVKHEGEREEEEAWKESVRRYKAASQAETHLDRYHFHAGQAERLRACLTALVEHHEREASKHLAEKGS